MKKIYLDNAATTSLSEEVIDAMVGVLKNNYGNPSSTHSFGQDAKIAIENVRRDIAHYLKISPSEVIFTSCGTESNNMVLKGSIEHLGVERIISSPLEHKCVSETIMDLRARKGVEVVMLRPDQNGDIQIEDIEKAIKASNKKTLVSLMHGNNEIGNLLDIEKVALICKENNVLFHSDTVQTVGHFELDFSTTLVDFAACSAHKFHGPKGSGFVFIRKSSGLKGLISGGPQERSLRAGTENVCGIVGLGKALELSMNNLVDHAAKIQTIKEYTIQKLQEAIPQIQFSGKSADRRSSLYTLLSVLLPFQDPLIGMKLDMQGIAVSQGSACSSGASKPSMVLSSILDDDQLNELTPLRISFSHLTTMEEIDFFVEAIKKIADHHIIEKANH